MLQYDLQSYHDTIPSSFFSLMSYFFGHSMLEHILPLSKLKICYFTVPSAKNLDSILKSRDITLPTSGPYSKRYGFSSSHVQMWELDSKEGWVLKNWYFQIVVLENTLESSLNSKEIKPVNPQGNQPWIFIGRTDAKIPTLWPFDVKSRLIGKDPDAGKDWGQEEKGMPEDEMVGWHHQLNGHEFEQTLGNSEGQGSVMCCSPWGHKELGTT